jgi:hypothetical protein
MYTALQVLGGQRTQHRLVVLQAALLKLNSVQAFAAGCSV